MSELLGWAGLSLRIAVMAVCLAAVVSIPVAFFTARRRSRWLSPLETLLVLPLVLPPTVAGYFLVVLLGRYGPIGWLTRSMIGHTLLFTEPAAVIAATIVVLPLIYLPTKSAFAEIDPELLDNARLLGASTARLFWHVSLPLGRRGIGAGLVLAFARALGEFGATVMVLGIHGQMRTLPIAIYLDYESGDSGHAWPAIGVLLGISLMTMAVYNRLNRVR
ncbi:MAG: molybdate ABC transporter permease subunit [Tepidisphaeraceae bacterium]